MDFLHRPPVKGDKLNFFKGAESTCVALEHTVFPKVLVRESMQRDMTGTFMMAGHVAIFHVYPASNEPTY